jgi:K+-sensing histidine kinase KdpD
MDYTDQAGKHRLSIRMLLKNRELYKKNLEIEDQKKEILDKALLLEQQASALDEHNKVRINYFQSSSHDLKSPMYALQNVFFQCAKI